MVFCCEVGFNEMFSSLCAHDYWALNLTFDVIILDAKHNALIMTPLFIDSFTLLLFFRDFIRECATFFFEWFSRFYSLFLLFFAWTSKWRLTLKLWILTQWGAWNLWSNIVRAPFNILCECNLLFISHTFSLLYSNAKMPSIPYFCSRFLSHSIKSRCWNQQIFFHVWIKNLLWWWGDLEGIFYLKNYRKC